MSKSILEALFVWSKRRLYLLSSDGLNIAINIKACAEERHFLFVETVDEIHPTLRATLCDELDSVFKSRATKLRPLGETIKSIFKDDIGVGHLLPDFRAERQRGSGVRQFFGGAVNFQVALLRLRVSVAELR